MHRWANSHTSHLDGSTPDRVDRRAVESAQGHSSAKDGSVSHYSAPAPRTDPARADAP